MGHYAGEMDGSRGPNHRTTELVTEEEAINRIMLEFGLCREVAARLFEKFKKERGPVAIQ